MSGQPKCVRDYPLPGAVIRPDLGAMCGLGRWRSFVGNLMIGTITLPVATVLTAIRLVPLLPTWLPRLVMES